MAWLKKHVEICSFQEQENVDRIIIIVQDNHNGEKGSLNVILPSQECNINTGTSQTNK